MRHRTTTVLALFVTFLVAPLAGQPARLGYYRFPAIWRDTLVFTAEGDLWRVPLAGGVAQRLTTHPAAETRPAISPDGRTVAYSASYEGPTEVYTLPLEGGVPVRQTYDGGNAQVVGWTPAGEILYATTRFSGLPNTQLAKIDPATRTRTLVPLAQASDGAYDAKATTLFFTRLAFQGSHTRRYRGGTAQNLWKFTDGAEAVPLTGDYDGTSKTPMPWQGRIYFASDRDGAMNIWSMAEAGGDLRQHTQHRDFEVRSPSLSEGRIAYQLGADIHVLDLASGNDRAVPITLVSDFDQMREKWVTSPIDWVTSAHLSPDGDRVALTARGQVFVAPALQGRLVEATRNPRVRYRNARFFPDGKTVLALSDESGEVEFWRVPANGVGSPAQLTSDGKVLRWDGLPSPDGRLIAHHDKDGLLWIYDIAKKTQTKVAEALDGRFDEIQWSPDSRWLAYVVPGPNQLARIWVLEAATGRVTPVTTDRYDSGSPAWSPDGKWLYFLSDRHFESSVSSPWGSRQPEPYFDKQTKVYALALKKGERSPFQPDDELHPAKKEEAKEPKKEQAGEEKPASAKDAKKDVPKGGKKDAAPAGKPDEAAKPAAVPRVEIDLEGIEARIVEIPVPPGNYSDLSVDGKRLYYVSRDAGRDAKRMLKTFPIDNKKPEAETFAEDIVSYELSQDGKKLLLRKAKDFYVLDAAAKAPAAPELAKRQVPLKDWTFRLDPREEWAQMYQEAWRLERDYFYDRGMHGLDWPAIKARFQPLAERVTDREELSDVLAQMVSELSALHIFVYGGDRREGQDRVTSASLGARLARDEAAGGYRVEHIYRSDADRPDRLAPLTRPGVGVGEGDVIEAVNGVPTLSVPDIASLLRNQADKQVLLRVKPKGGGAARDAIAVPISQSRENELRYDEWEYTRRLAVEKASGGKIGYVHLRAMGSNDIAQWYREYYPVFDREGLIIDVRHNNGGNIDSWVLGRLLRKAWFYWQPRVGRPTWNMQYAFRGHLVVLCDQSTASDGEAFAEGFRRLGLGKLIGTRTWGGEIWLSSSNVLVDRGIATAAEIGVYGPEGQWLIEGHGVDPDIVVDNLPHATFKGEDAQLDAAVQHLTELIKTKPVQVPPPPPYPIKRGGENRGKM
ncbi:MAG TPA: S41 family peptidase [Vicinamibacterales bacterium]|nr:S41 family peptidase [Vicinamibacterales bacterium]